MIARSLASRQNDAAGAVGHAEDKPTLFKRHDKPMDARLGRQTEGLFHLLEGGANTIVVSGVALDEIEQFLLPARHAKTGQDWPVVVLFDVRKADLARHLTGKPGAIMDQVDGLCGMDAHHSHPIAAAKAVQMRENLVAGAGFDTGTERSDRASAWAIPL